MLSFASVAADVPFDSPSTRPVEIAAIDVVDTGVTFITPRALPSLHFRIGSMS